MAGNLHWLVLAKAKQGVKFNKTSTKMVIGGEKERDPMRLVWIQKGSVGEEYYYCNAEGNLEYKDSWGWGVRAAQRGQKIFEFTFLEM